MMGWSSELTRRGPCRSTAAVKQVGDGPSALSTPRLKSTRSGKRRSHWRVRRRRLERRCIPPQHRPEFGIVMPSGDGRVAGAQHDRRPAPRRRHQQLGMKGPALATRSATVEVGETCVANLSDVGARHAGVRDHGHARSQAARGAQSETLPEGEVEGEAQQEYLARPVALPPRAESRSVRRCRYLLQARILSPSALGSQRVLVIEHAHTGQKLAKAVDAQRDVAETLGALPEDQSLPFPDPRGYQTLPSDRSAIFERATRLARRTSSPPARLRNVGVTDSGSAGFAPKPALVPDRRCQDCQRMPLVLAPEVREPQSAEHKQLKLGLGSGSGGRAQVLLDGSSTPSSTCLGELVLNSPTLVSGSCAANSSPRASGLIGSESCSTSHDQMRRHAPTE